MSTFISYIAFIGALASNFPYVASVAEIPPETIAPVICPEFDTETVLDFHHSTFGGSTLGNPNYEAGDGELRFRDVGIHQVGESITNIDLVVTQAPGTNYTSGNLGNNGLNGHYGQINIESNNGSGTFDFCFENSSNGESMTLDTFFFSFLDLDGNTDMQGFETISLANDTFTTYYLSNDTEIVASENNGLVEFESTTAGYGIDNPDDLDNLTALQQNRLVMFQIDNANCFQVKFAVNCIGSCDGGRNFLFAGKAEQIVEKCETAMPTPTPTDFPTIIPSYYPTTNPTELPVTSEPTLSPTDSYSGAFGDPHIKTWTGNTYDFHGVCDLVLFSNPSFDNGSGVDVHIRNKRMNMWSFIETSAIRIGKDTFELKGSNDNDIFLINGIVQKIENEDEVVGSISGYDIKFMQVSENSRKFVINLGTNQSNNNIEEIIFTTWKSFVSVGVKNPTKEHFDGSVGLMGSFPAGVMVARDGKTVFDDSNQFGQEWQVLNSEPQLFAQRGTVGPNDMCSSPSNIEMRRRLQASVVTLKEAENACNSVHKEMKDLCIFDVMATNDKSSSGAY